jgi:hypothetical protein
MKGWRLFRSHTNLILGNGSRIRFWDDVWCGEMPLNEAFPILYSIACDKNTLVAAHLVSESDSIQWDVSFIRVAQLWLPSSPCCIPLEWIVKGKISFGGLLLTKGNLMLDLSIRSFLAKR